MPEAHARSRTQGTSVAVAERMRRHRPERVSVTPRVYSMLRGVVHNGPTRWTRHVDPRTEVHVVRRLQGEVECQRRVEKLMKWAVCA